MTETSSTTYNVPLSSATITIIAPAQGASSNDPQVFPHLRLRIKPHATVTSVLAPPSPRGKGLEEEIKVVPPTSGKVVVAWEIDASGLPVEEHDKARIGDKVEMAVGEWLVLNQKALGVERFDYPQEFISTSPGGQLLFTPKSALPSDRLDAPIIPSGEPVACLTRIDIFLKWSFPSATRGRKRKTKEDVLDPETQAAQIAALSFEAIFGEQTSSQISSESQSTQKAAAGSETSQDSQEGVQQAEPSTSETTSETQVLPQVQDPDTPEAEQPVKDNIDAEAEVLVQVGLGMQKVMRLQMIRRFPYVFDGNFIKCQPTLLMPSGLFDAFNCFLTLSARHDTPLLGKCRELFEELQSSQFKALKHQANAMARLQTYARQPKRNKNDSQQSSPASTQAELEGKREEECVDKVATYLQRLRLADDNKSAEDKLRDSLARGLAVTGLAGWMQIRQGYSKKGAAKAPLQEPENFHEVPSTLQCEGDLPPDSATQLPLPSPPFTTFASRSHPQTHPHEETQNPYDERLHNPDDCEDLDDLDAEEYYEDDVEESLGDSIEDILGTPHRTFGRSPNLSDAWHIPHHQYHDNALHLDVEAVSQLDIGPRIVESSFTYQEYQTNEYQAETGHDTLYESIPVDVKNERVPIDGGWSSLAHDPNPNLDVAPDEEFDDLDDDHLDDSGREPPHNHQFQSHNSLVPSSQDNPVRQSFHDFSNTPASTQKASYWGDRHNLHRTQSDDFRAESLEHDIDNPYPPVRENNFDELDDLDELEHYDNGDLDCVFQQPHRDAVDPDDDIDLEDSLQQSDPGLPLGALSISSLDTLSVSQHRLYSGREDDTPPSIKHDDYEINDLDDEYPHTHTTIQGLDAPKEYTEGCDYPGRSDFCDDIASLAYDPHLDESYPQTTSQGDVEGFEIDDLDDLDNLDECDNLDDPDDRNNFANHQPFEPLVCPRSPQQALTPSDFNQPVPAPVSMHMGIYSYDDISDDLDDE